MIGHAKEKNGLYYLDTSSGNVGNGNQLPLSFLFESSSSNKDQIWLYHFRLGHPSFNVLKVMFPLLFKNIDVDTFHCDVREFAKHRCVSFPLSSKRSSFPFALIHSDIWGSSFGARWFVSFIDDCTCVTWIFLLKQKLDVSIVFPNYHNMVKNQFGVSIKRVRSDNAKDYFNQTLSSYFQKEGIIHESLCQFTPTKWSS